MTNKNERRFFSDAELRVETRGENAPVLRGHAAVFNQLSENLGGFRERIAPGTFTDAIREDDVRALINHDPHYVLGRNTAGTLSLSEDQRGLAVEISPPDTQAASDLLKSIERGDITQMSFGFRTVEDSWDEEDGTVIRTLKKVRLRDVSAVTYPAYPQTDVAARAFELWKESQYQPDTTEMRKRLMDSRLAEVAR